MNWRSLIVVRAFSAAGLLLGGITANAPAQDVETVAPGAEYQAESVQLLDARDNGLIEVAVRGQGDDRVALRIENKSPRRLSVVIPPGLVAASTTGQFQSMGLGLPTNHPGSFGEFRSEAPALGGFRAIPVTESRLSSALTLPAGQNVELTVPAVCLNFGLADPTPRDRFLLTDVSEYTPDLRAQRALRTVAILGTSQGVAQAVAWNVFNGLNFETMVARAPKKINGLEAALAARLIQAVDSSSSELVESAYLTEGRVFVRVQGEGDLTETATALAENLEGMYLFGLPVRVVRGEEQPGAVSPALYLVVTLTASSDSQTAGRVAVKGLSRDGRWVSGGSAKLNLDVPATSADASMLAIALDEAVSREFVSVRSVKRVDGGTLVRVENRLPFTLSRVILDANADSSAPVAFDRVGIGPLRSTELLIPATSASLSRIEFNGL